MDPQILLRILTLNIFLRPNLISSYWNGDYKEERMTDFVKIYADQYDIICFQEVFGSWSHRRERFIELLSNEAGFKYHVHSSDNDPSKYNFGKLGCIGFSSPFLTTDAGLLIVSKYPIIETNEIVFKQSKWSDAMARKGVLHARIKMNDTYIVNIFTTHLQSGIGDEAHSIRMSQLKELRYFIINHNDARGFNPSILTGDFNMNGLEAPEYYTLKNQFQFTFPWIDTLRIQENTSYGHANIFDEERETKERIDYIFFSQSQEYGKWKCLHSSVNSFSVDDRSYKRISDHDGVEATFKYNK